MLEDIIAQVERTPITQPGETAPNHPLENVFAQAEGRAPMSPVNPLQQGQPQQPANRSQLTAPGTQPTDDQNPGFLRELGKGAISGWQGANKAVNDLLEYTGTLTGSDTLREVGKTGSEYWGEKVKANAPRVQNFTDLDWSKPRDVLDWAAWNIGQMGGQIATTLPFMAMGRAKAGADAAIGAGQALKGLFTEGGVKQAGKFLAQWAKPKAMDIPIGILEAGSVAEGQLERLKKGEMDELDPIRGLAAAFVATKLEELGAENMVNRLFAKGTTGIKGQLFRKIGQQALATGFGEGAEEFFQTYAEQAGINPAELATKDMFMEAVNGAAAGAIGGAAMGTGGGAYSHYSENKDIEKIKGIKPAYVPTEELPAIHQRAMELSESRPGDKDLATLRDSYATEIEKRKGNTSDARQELLQDEDPTARSNMTAKDILNDPAEKSGGLPADIPGVDTPAEQGIDVEAEEDLTPEVMTKLDQVIAGTPDRRPMEAAGHLETGLQQEYETGVQQAKADLAAGEVDLSGVKAGDLVTNSDSYRQGYADTINEAEKTKNQTTQVSSDTEIVQPGANMEAGPEESVFNRMPDAVLKQQADYGVQGAKDELKKRQAAKDTPETETADVSTKNANAQPEAKEAVSPSVGNTVSWTTGKGNSVSGTVTKLDDDRLTVKTDGGKTYSLNPAKAKNFSITAQGGIANEEAGTATNVEIANGTQPGSPVTPELKIAGTKGKRGPGKVEGAKEESKEEGQEVAAKKPWEMTMAEFRKRPDVLSDAQAYAQHYTEVKQALAEGKSVPPEVLADYPDLVTKQTSLPEETTATKSESYKEKNDREVREARVAGHDINDHGVYNNSEEITIPFGKKAKRTGSVNIAKGADGKFRIGVHISKQYGDFDGSGSLPGIHDDVYDTREEALAAGLDYIRKRIKTDDIQGKTAMADLDNFVSTLSNPPEIKPAGTGGKRGADNEEKVNASKEAQPDGREGKEVGSEEKEDKTEVKAAEPEKREDAHTAAVGVISGGVADRIKDSKYEFVYGETKKGSDTYYDMAGMFGGGGADRLAEAGITVKKKVEETKAASIDDEIQNISMEEFDALIDEVIAEAEGKALESSTQKRPSSEKPSHKDLTRDRGAVISKKKEETRSLESILADATKEGFGGASEAIKGLYELFGGGSLKSFPGGIDTDTYAKAKPHFDTALEHMRNAGKGLKDFVAFFVEKLGKTVKPYLTRYLQDLKGIEPVEESTSDVENSTGDVETKEEDTEKPINLDENTGKGERGSRKKLTEQEKAEREAKKQAAKEKKEKKAALGNFQNVGYVYDPEKISSKIKDKPPKSAAKIILDEMAPARVWKMQFPEEATPGVVRMAGNLQKYFKSFKEYIVSDRSKLWQYAYRNEKIEKSIDRFFERGGSISEIKEWAKEYGELLQPVVDAFQGQTGIVNVIDRLQTTLLHDDVYTVGDDGDRSYVDWNDAQEWLNHPSFSRDLHADYGRSFYKLLTADWQKLVEDENDILLSEINIHKRTRNKTVVRIGLPDYREGIDLQKTEDFQEPFGFSGVGFGEEGWINQEERHRVVNAAFDAFKDLADTIGATDKGMSIGGQLAVQFANLGHKAKGAAAAYFPTVKTINFTRDHGDGTMAHEWGHGLHDLAAPNTRDEINNVIEMLKYVFDFEAGERLVDDLLAKDSLFLKRMVSSKKQHRIEAVKKKVKADFEKTVRKETDYYKTAKDMDADYTARAQEMWARAFETYIYDTLAGTDNYLVNDFVAAGRVGGKSQVGTRLVYPAGIERETFNETIKHFVEGLEWNENGLPSLKEGYESINEFNEKILQGKLTALLDSVEERYKAIWTSEPSADGYFWYQYNETGFGPMMQPDGYVAHDKKFNGEGQNGTGAVGYLTQLHPDDILDYKLTNIQYEGENATYISGAQGGINDGIQEDGTETLDDELPAGERTNDSPGDIRTTERGSGGDGQGGSRHVSRERGADSSGEGDGDSGVHLSTAPGNYRITDPTLTDPKSVAERFNKNLAAVKVLKVIESENRSASPGVVTFGEEPPGGWTDADKVSHKYNKLIERGNEKDILAGYTGWGGMSELFSWDPGKAWAGRAELLKAQLDREEIRGAESSSTSSYYTPVPVGQFMWKLAQRLGFERGVVLDPATGASGLFFGTMPVELQQNVALQGIEMDGLSARIASKLYELASIDHNPFQSVKKPNNRYDLTITNVPFEGITPSDPKHNKGNYLLHNYYINKMLDLTAPGALSMMITTSNTMDKAESHLAEYAKKADLVGAIRLPSDIYSATGVVTDIMVFRKKIEGSKFQGIPVEEWTTAGIDESTGLTINSYFLKHPEMVAGKLEVVQGRWGDEKLRVVGEGDLQTNLERLAAAFPAKIVEREAVREVKSIDDIIAAPGTVKEGGLYINDKGEACEKADGEELKLPTATASEKKKAEIAKGFVKILDQVRTVLRAQKTIAAEAEIKAAQKQLKKEYDDFVKKHGPVNDPKIATVYNDSTDSDWVLALEEYDLDTGKVIKLADIFTKDITASGQTPSRAENDHDALAMSLNEFGYPNLEYMAKLRGSDVESVMKGVSDKIVEDPESGFLVTMDEYLSGNVKRKLLVAREMSESNPEYDRNVKLLEAAQPDEIPAHRITARIGASWVHPEHLADYVRDKLNLDDDTLRAIFNFSPISNEWSLSFRGRPNYRGKNWGEENKAETERQIFRARHSVEATRIWGTDRRDFIALIQNAIEGKRPEVTYRGSDNKPHLDEVATQAAENKLQEIQADFGRWLFDESTRADEAVKRFNDLINTSIPPKADGSHLTFPGKSMAMLTQKEKETLGPTDAVAFYPHQQNAVWKYLRGGNLYLAHEVGAGKTVTMALLAMEAKRLRGKKKVLYVTLNDSTMGQAVAEIKKLYPLANVLQVRVSTQEQRQQRALQKLAMNDFDIAIMRQQDLNRIALSPEAETVFIEEELMEYREILEEAKSNGSRIQEQQIQQAIHALEEKLRAPSVHDEAKRKNLYFDDLGIDLMIVDEAHQYKNVPYATRLHRITGLNPAGSPTAKDFFRKTQYMNAQYSKQDGVVLASGTALSNSIAEFYNIQRMLQPREVKRKGVWSFDRWIANYGDMGSQLEWDGARGEYKNITTNRKIVNAGRLLATAYQNIDCVRAEDTPIRRPKIRGGEPQRIKVQPNQYVEEYKQIVLQRCKEIEDDPKNAMFEGVPDNMLRVISNMSKIAIDQRLDSRYENTEIQEDSKIYKASRLIRQRWEEEAEHKGVQVVFADIGIPKRYINFKYKTDEELEKLTDEQLATYNQNKTQFENAANKFSTYDGLKDELVKLGIPAEQIAFIHDADDSNKQKKDAKLRKLFKKVNDGEIRILIGSTDKAGTGVNIQKRISDVHHLDVWWNYSSWEQRNGRAIRAGNIYTDLEGVYIHNYVTETTVDATRWDKIFAKGKVLNATLGGDINLDVIEDISEETMSAKMMAAEASGNPLMAKQATLMQQVQGLRFEQSNFLDNVRQARMELAATPDRIASREKNIEDCKKSRAIMEKVTAVRFAGDDRTLTFEKHGKEIAEALEKAVAKDAKSWDAEMKAPLLIFGSHTVTEKTVEEGEGKTKKVKEYTFAPLTAKAEITGVEGDPYGRRILLSGGIMNSEKSLADIKIKGKTATIDVKANISRTVTEYLSRLDSMEEKAKEAIADLKEDEPKFRKIAETPWGKAEVLQQKINELAEVELAMAAQGDVVGNPETGIEIQKFKGSIPVLEDMGAKNDWKITDGGVVYPGEYDTAIAIRKNVDLNKFSQTKTKFKPQFVSDWNAPDQVSLLMNSTKPESEEMKPVAYTTIDNVSRFWMCDKFSIRGNEVALSVDPTSWRFLERVLGNAGTWHPEAYGGSAFLIHVDHEGKRDAMIWAKPERSIPDGVAALMGGVPETPQYSRAANKSRGMAVDRVQSIVDKATSFLKAAPKVNVVQYVSEIPVGVMEDMDKWGMLDDNMDSDVQGFSWKGQVWIVADNIDSSKEAVFVLMHELTHDGLGSFLRKDKEASPLLNSIRSRYNTLMDAIYQAHKKDVRKIARTTHTHLDLSTIAGCRQSAEEWLCNQAYEAQSKWYDKLVAVFNDILRAMGFDVKLSDAEVRTVLQDAFKSFGEREGAIRYMVAAWHGGRNLEGGRFKLLYNRHDEGRGAFGYGLYFSDLDEIGKKYAEEEAERTGAGERHLYRVTLHKGKTPDQYDWIDWYKPITDKQIEKYKKYVQEKYHNGTRFDELTGLIDQYRGRFSGNHLYRTLSGVLGSDRDTSAFLLDAGIDGIRYPADAIYGTETNATNYVVFDENAITVDEHIRYSRKGKNGDADETASLFPEVEERIRQAKGVKHASIKDKAKDLLGLAWTEMSRHFPHLDPKTQGKTIEVLRQFQEVPVWAKQAATDKLDEFIGKLSPDDRHVFGMNLILADMLRDLDSGLLTPHPEEGLPFGYRHRDQVQQDLDHFSEIADQRPEIREALQKRNDYMSEINDQMIALKILPKNLANDPATYFHHQVLAYLNYQSENKGLDVSARDVKKRRKGWQFSRQGSVKDYNTEYVEAEFEVLSQALSQIKTVETINKIDRLENIKRDLEDDAKQANMKAFWSHFDPLDEPLKPYSIKMAMGFSRLEKLTEIGEIYYPPEFEDLEDHIRRVAEEKAEGSEGTDFYQPHPKMFAFLSYLVNHGDVGAVPAATILKTIGERNKFIRNTVGEKNWTTFRDLIPEGYVSYKPDAHPAFYFANSIQDQVLEQVLTGNRNLQDRDVRAVLAKARDAEWIVPEGVAQTLNDFRPATENSLVGKLSADTLSMWKQWVLINPFRVFRYNLNNMSGDLDIAMAYDPKIITKYMVQAFKDLKAARKGMEPGKLKDELDSAMQKGVIGSGITQWEIPDLSDVQSVKGLVDFFDGKSGNAVTKAWNLSKSVTTLRENILRLAAYRYFRAQFAGGKKNLYGASNREEIDQITNMDDRAAKLARELLGDYGNISHAGQYIRKRLIPFYSWMEINAPRYVRLFRNVKHEGGGYGGMASVTAWKAAKLGVKAMALMGMIMLWNATFFPDEEDELQETGRDQLHLILGRREDGSIRTIRFQGALSDALSWFGLDNPLETAKLYAAGRKSMGDIAKETVKAAPVKLFQGLRPEPKLLYEVASGQSFYPDPTRTRPIHDTTEHILRTFSLDKPYNLAAGKPRPDGSLYEQLKKDISGMLLNYSDPGEQAYYTARKQVFEWLEENGKERPAVMPTNRSNALYYYKQALKYGDFKAAEKYLKKYKELGGKESNVKGSVKRAAPLASLKLSDRYKFKQSLSSEQQETLRLALDWYKKHYVEARHEEVSQRTAAIQ